jgi:hypothetical protein
VKEVPLAGLAELILDFRVGVYLGRYVFPLPRLGAHMNVRVV